MEDRLPLFLGEGLLPHCQVLLVLHKPEQRGASFNPQPIVVIF